MAWFDAGVNLLDARLDAEQVIADAANQGVTRLCVITTQPDEWGRAAELYERFPQSICYTVGVHPHNARLVTDRDLDTLAEAIGKPGVVAVGECGLDFNRNFSAPDVQVGVFAAQLEIAAHQKKPVYLHERDAFQTQIDMLARYQGVLAGIAHCFTGDVAQMRRYLEIGLHIGITGWACDPVRGEALRSALPTLPLDRLILETDAPYLYPKTRRPRQRHNAPAYLPFIGEQVSEILKVSPVTLQQSSYANTCRLFQIVD